MVLKSTAAREHVEEIRRTKFSISVEPNPFTEDPHPPVQYLPAELYPNDVNFLMELIQNAENNEYPEGVDPSLELVITSKDITNTGAPVTLLVFNNDKGFLAKDIESICSVGRSTKRAYIGEIGIGFKSVFLITAQPYIVSNGYQIRFNEKPCEQCNVGYIVPEWVEEDPILSAIQRIYGPATVLPTTTLVLPLKPDKVSLVKDLLSSVHPEVLLFLSKIRRLSVREDNQDPNLNTVMAISIHSEKVLFTWKSVYAASYTVHLTTAEVDTEYGYYMWKQRFPVKQENGVDVRMNEDECEVTLAFPHGQRFQRGASLPGVYSLLPTETVTNFPFIIQADFLLASSRANILWDNGWNQRILDCVPDAFINAFTSLVKTTEKAPVSTLRNMFRFLPVKESSHPKLNDVRDAIKAKLMKERIVPCESYIRQKFFCKPSEVGTLKPAFRSILNKARSEGVTFSNISSHGAYPLAPSFDTEEYNVILEFLEIGDVGCEWYAKCIGSSNLVMGVSEDVYIRLLVFLAEGWESWSDKTSIKNTPLIKYVGQDGKVDLLTMVSGTNKLLAVKFTSDSDCISWLINWNRVFQRLTGQFFLPKVTQNAIRSCSKKLMLVEWLKKKMGIRFASVYMYAGFLSSLIRYEGTMAVSYAHFLYTSLENDYLLKHEVPSLCSKMPVVDKYGQVHVRTSNGRVQYIIHPKNHPIATVGRIGKQSTDERCWSLIAVREGMARDEILVPAKGSRWAELLGANLWRQYNFVELGEDYTRNMSYFGGVISGEELVSFLQTYDVASDVPHLSPPDAAIPTLSAPLTKRNTFLLLEWIHHLNASGVDLPERFWSSITSNPWLKVMWSGSHECWMPKGSFMLDSPIGKLLQDGSLPFKIPLVDEKFYGGKLKQYKEELQTIGVRARDSEACEFIGQLLMRLAATSKLSRSHALSILKFIEFLGKNHITSGNFINSIRGGKWVRTSLGVMTPSDSVLFSQEWNGASQISDIPFLNQEYYGEEILSFKKQLRLLGVVVDFDNSYQLVSDNLKMSYPSSTCLSSEAMLLLLRCIKGLESSDRRVLAIKNLKCLKTNLGYVCPSECFLLNSESEWCCLLQGFGLFPILDQKFYGSSIFSMENELKKIGVMVDFEEAVTEFTQTFQQLSSIGKEHVLSFLQCYGKLKKLQVKLPDEFNNCIRQEKWLRTRLGDYRSPNDCILFGPEWKPISSISLLPFIDDSNDFYGIGIHGFREELKELGVVTDFKDGAKFVAEGLVLPQDCTSLTPGNVYALLDSVKRLKETGTDLPDKFLEKVSQKRWLKTHFGYKRPHECLAFDSAWVPFLKSNDGPFIDEDLYGHAIRSYRDELNLLGVITDINDGCQLLASCLIYHSNSETISRIYNYLSAFKCELVDEDSTRIWIPRGTDTGEWVMSRDCVLHDKNDLFGEHLNVLENFKYEKKVLDLFANAFNVKVHPSVQDYCKLWEIWENSGRQITQKECSAFWEFVIQNWNPTTEVTIINNVSKLPVLNPASNGILLSDKRSVFIGDDLFLTGLFQTCSYPIFIWYPQPNLKALTGIYSKLGVQTLSKSVQKNICDVDRGGFEPVNLRNNIIKNGLFKLILGFLADPNLGLDPATRHEAVSRILAIEAYETLGKMTVRYSLSLSSGDVVDVEPTRMIHWDKQQSKLFMQKMETSTSGYKNVIKYASHFAQEIAEVVLLEKEELAPGLSELIRLGYLVEFDEEAVEFLMNSKNLQIFVEDQEYLSSTFSSS